MSKTTPTVLLINPPVTAEQKRGPLGPVIRNLYFNSPPLGIAYIAAVLEHDKVPVHLIDAAVEDFSMEETLDRVGRISPSLVGITSTTNFFRNALELAGGVKKRFPGITTLIGGPHPTSNMDSVMTNECFDFGCVGEGEMTTLELVAALSGDGSLDDVKGLVFRRDGRVVRNAPRPLIEDLDILPAPARHLLPLMKYIPQPNDGPFLPKTAMITSRGCPFKCIFCDHGIYGPTYRSFSAARIVDEMQDLVTRYGIRDIAFVDSLFMMSTKRVNDITDEIMKRGLKVHWTCTIRANIATREVMEKMKKAGCWRVRIGVEAGNEEVLKLIKKEVTKEQVRKAVEDAAGLDLHPKAFFMVGHPGETRERIEESIEFAKSLPLTDVTVQINTPLPGAPQWKMMKEYGTITDEDFEKYSFWEPVFVPKGMTAEELNELHRKFYRAFYFRPVVIWRHMRMIRHWHDIGRYLRALSLMINMFVKKRRDRIQQAAR